MYDSPHRVVAVIPSFRPDVSLVLNCERLAKQVDAVVIVDDGSGDAYGHVLTGLESRGFDVSRMPKNRGIGYAINIGIERARQLGAKFVVTFDQDSAAPEGFVSALMDEFERVSTRGIRVGMVCPEFYGNTSQAGAPSVAGVMSANAPIQSGSFFPVSVFFSLGPQRDDFFIDLIDTEYFFRLRRAGYEVVVVPRLRLPHGFGHKLFVYALGRKLTKRDGRPRMVAVSSPFRYYYRARNRIMLYREYRADPDFRRTLRAQARNDLLLDFGVAIYSARGKGALLRVILAGWRDGLRGRTGKMPDSVRNLAQRVSWRHPVGHEVNNEAR